jgi:hypothetical protein
MNVIIAKGIKSSGRALLFRGGNVTVTLSVRLLFLIRTSRDHMTRPQALTIYSDLLHRRFFLP